MDNVDDILRKLYEDVLDSDGKRIPETRIMVFGTRIFVPKYLTNDDVIVCTDLVDYIYLKRIGTYHNLHYVAHNKVSEWVNKNQFLENLYNCIGNKNGIGMKLGETITNPPYDGDLHLQLLDELTNISDKVVCIHPGRWVEDILAQYKGKGATGRKFEHLKKMLTKVMMIKQKDGCQMFNIELKQDMMIGAYESNHNNTDELPIYTNPKMFFSVLDNILKYAHNVANIGERTDTNPTGVSDRDKDDGIRCQVFDIKPMIDYVKDPKCSSAEYHVKVIGNDVIIDGKVNGVFWANANKKNTKTHGKEVGTPIPISIKVSNTNDAKTIVNLYQTPLMKNIINLIKYDQNVGHTHIPYFDPKVIKTEDDVLDALGITDENYRNWLKRDVYDYREKDFIKYGECIDC